MPTNEVIMLPAKCTSCDAALDFTPDADRVVCPYCGSVYVIQKPKVEAPPPPKGFVQSILDYRRDKEEREAQLQREEAERQERRRLEDEEKSRRTRKTVLWALGWIFIFPVPLTILLMRKKTVHDVLTDDKLTLGIIVVAWIAYLWIFFIRPTGTSEPPRTTPPAATTTYATTLRTTTQTKRTTTTRTTTTEATDTTILTESTQSIASTTTAVTRSDAEIMAAVKNGDYSLVTPEFKQTMDAYEAFYDEYIGFMKRYESGEGDIMGMLNDYLSMLEKLEQWSDKIDAIDEDKLSPADDAYYLLVTLRVEQKLLGAVW